MDEVSLALELSKYVYNGGLTGIIFWLVYDIRTIKTQLRTAISKVDVSEMIHCEMALVKQEQSHIKEQLDRIETKLDDMRKDFYLPRTGG